MRHYSISVSLTIFSGVGLLFLFVALVILVSQLFAPTAKAQTTCGNIIFQYAGVETITDCSQPFGPMNPNQDLGL